MSDSLVVIYLSLRNPLSLLELIRLWAHEALRLFHDRLISDQERKWCNEQINVIAHKYFNNLNLGLIYYQ